MRRNLIFVCFFVLSRPLLGGLLLTEPVKAADIEKPVWVARIVHDVPRTHEELAATHAASRWGALEVPIADPLEIKDFAGRTEYTITTNSGGHRVKRQLPFDYSRRAFVAYAMRIDEEDEAELPVVSKRRILRVVNGRYICMQLRVHRDAAGNVYLYYKPFAAVGSYTAPGTHEFSPLIESSIRDFRGIGLFVKRGSKLTPDSFRTFVAINKNQLAVGEHEDGTPKVEDHYELSFVRARVNGDKVDLHTFATSEHRKRLNYMAPFKPPGGSSDCGLTSTIIFTSYTLAKQSPVAKAARRVDFNTKQDYLLEDLDRFAVSEGWEGDALANLTALADAVIDGKVAAYFGAQ